MIISLAKFNKKINSIEVPQPTWRDFNCRLLDDTSLLAPIIELEYTNLDIFNYNYAYIPTFKRYYYLSDIVSSNNLWRLYLKVDVLASHYMDIVYSNQYVIRSSFDYNNNIIDTSYISYIDNSDNYMFSTIDNAIQGGNDVTVLNRKTNQWVGCDYFNRSYKQGAFCIGVISNNASGMTYYIMPYLAFKQFVQGILSLVPSDMTDVSNGVGKALYNPMQYITYCKWYPTMPIADNLETMVRTINIGGYDFNFPTVDTFCHTITGQQVDKFRSYIPIPKRTEYNTYPYLALSPYSNYNLYFQPFGDIPIDSTKIYKATHIRVEWELDYTNGSCRIIVYNNENNGIVYNNCSILGVEVPLSSMVVDWKGALALSGLSYMRNLFGDIGNISINDGVNAINETHGTNFDIGNSILSGVGNKSIIGTAMDVIGASMGQVQTQGNLGSMLGYNGLRPRLYCWYYNQVSHDDDNMGRPLYEIKQLIRIPGYLVCRNPHIDFSITHPTLDEIQKINSFLSTGVYLK